MHNFWLAQLTATQRTLTSTSTLLPVSPPSYVPLLLSVLLMLLPWEKEVVG